MNATHWTTLTGFVRYLGKTGKVIADETEKGWFITYIDRDPDTIARQEALAKKEKLDKDDQERVAHYIEKQVERAKQTCKEEEVIYTELKRENEEEKIQIQLGPKLKKDETNTFLIPSTSFASKKESKKSPSLTIDEEASSSSKGNEKEMEKDKEKGAKKEGTKRKLSALDEIMKMEETKKEKVGRKDYWLTKNIVVKVVTKSLGDKYYKKKGYVKDVINLYNGLICMLDTGHTLKLDQEHLETVIPAEGRTVRVVNGGYRGTTAILKSIDEKKFCATIEIDSVI